MVWRLINPHMQTLYELKHWCKCGSAGAGSGSSTHLSHPEGDFIDLVDGHEGLHVVQQEDVVEDGRKQGQRAVQQRRGEDTMPAAPDAPVHFFPLKTAFCSELRSSLGPDDSQLPPHDTLKKKKFK